MEPAVKRRDVIQTAPRVRSVEEKNEGDPTAGGAEASLFPASSGPPKIFSRIATWGEVFHPRAPEPLQLSPSAVENYRKCPQRYLYGYLWSLKEGPKATLSFGSIMHGTVRRFLTELRKGNKLEFEDLRRLYEMEWRPVGFEDEYQEAEYRRR
jgi:hypothetical protein